MAGPQRKCANCRFFTDAGMPGNGWCTHPQRQPNTGVKLLVRGGELACRNSWGGDLFEDRLSQNAETATSSTSDTGASEDEVTSVTIPTGQPRKPEDRVVNDRPAPSRADLDANDAAHRDQAERARIMARGNRDALAGAIQRISSRRHAESHRDVVADNNDSPDHGSDRVVARQARFTDRQVASDQPPLRTDPVPRQEVEQRGGGPPDRFDTIPEIDPDFDMPGKRDRPSTAAKAAPSPDPHQEVEHAEAQFSSYEHVLQRARRIRTSKQERSKPLRHADIPGWTASPDQPLPDTDSREATQESTIPHVDNDLDVRDHGFTDTATDDEQPADHILGRDDTSARTEYTTEAASPDTASDDLLAVEWDDHHHWNRDDHVQPGPRRASWLSRFGIGRGALAHDDATVTRHAESLPEHDDAPGIDDRVASERQPREDHSSVWTARSYATDWPDVDLADAAPARRTHTDHRPAPVPATEALRHTGTRDRLTARPTPPARPQPRFATALPDLDDAIFDDWPAAPSVSAGAVSPQPAPAAPAAPSRSAAAALQSTSPRDSLFRSARFEDESPAPSPQAHAEEADTWDDEYWEDDADDDVPIDIRHIVAQEDDLADRGISVAPDIPRKCRTCRSFRSADGGTRGWCTNEFAFTHRRMVNDGDPACASAIGCWWLPADHLRLDLDDEVEDAYTPRMDELIGDRRTTRRRVAGE